MMRASSIGTQYSVNTPTATTATAITATTATPENIITSSSTSSSSSTFPSKQVSQVFEQETFQATTTRGKGSQSSIIHDNDDDDMEPIDYRHTLCTTRHHPNYNHSDYSNNYYQIQQVTSNAPFDTFSNVPYYPTNDTNTASSTTTATATATGTTTYNEKRMNRRSSLLNSLNRTAV